MKLYVASSWKNTFYPSIVSTLRTRGHEVWDWRNPPTGGNGFEWKQAAPGYTGGDVDLDQLWHMLDTPVAQAGFNSDLQGMMWADAGILLLPSGRSAHMEAGWLAGRGKRVYVLRPVPEGPDLMHLLFEGIYENLHPLMIRLEDDHGAR